ncbi:protein disulfide-isomerase precursor [Paecilomyces variotii No. 5]|uniref:Protein disulfide-isomerase n=1 Tax=Byssochlamys spectabilis (strain No. 5 / NBRC 109023) TaxID=1356009 RepID=V5HQP4_BYSSN|nr:protein disulfide-isomerase precursor [Paecilomyces variotii No. 5]
MMWFSLHLFLPPSNALLPELSQAASTLTAPLVTIDCTEETALCKKYDINAYPTIRLFRGLEENIRYRGPRAADAIISFMIKQQLPPLTTLDNETINVFKSIDDKVFIAYLPPIEGGADADDTPSPSDLIREIYTSVANENHDRFVFGISFDPDLAAKDGLPVPSIACYKTRSEGNNEALAGVEFSRRKVEEFVQAMSRDVIGEMNRRNMEGYMQPSKLLAYIFYDRPSTRARLRRSLGRLAKKLQDYAMFVTIDANEYPHIAASLDVQLDLLPALAVHNMMTDQVFVYDQEAEIRSKEVGKMLLDILQGKSSPGVQLVEGQETPESKGEQEGSNNGHDEL